MDNPKVSIIAPVYNVAPYLPNFIDSVINQTYGNWELLLVDDGATDGSGDICDQFAQCDNRIIVFHKPNEGVSSARNVGIKNMTGDWVIMPDPDDELPNDSIETLLKYASDDVDLVSASYTWYVNGALNPHIRQSFDGICNVDEYVSMMGIVPQPRNLDRRCCNKLFRASVIRDNNIFFPEDLHYREDILYNYQFLEKCKRKVCLTSYDMYIYYMRDIGAAISLQKKYNSKSKGKFIAMTRCYDILNNMGVNGEVKKRMKFEILNAHNSVSALIKESDTGKEDLPLLKKKLRMYFSVTELMTIYAKSRIRRMLSMVRI